MEERTQVVTDQIGRPFEAVAAGAADPASSLPSSEFTPEQQAMAKLPLPFRNMIRDPFVPDIGAAPATTAYPASFLADMRDKGCSSFRIINPNTCFVRFRGAANLNDKITEGQGRLMAPGAVEVFSTQNPTHLSVMPVARPGFPVPADLAPLELNYGAGS